MRFLAGLDNVSAKFFEAGITEPGSRPARHIVLSRDMRTVDGRFSPLPWHTPRCMLRVMIHQTCVDALGIFMTEKCRFEKLTAILW